MPTLRLFVAPLLVLPLIACAVHDVHDVETAAQPPQATATDVAATLTAANAHFNAGRWGEAARGYDTVLAADPSQGVAWFRLGYALHAQGKLERACKVHAKATEFPQYAPVAAYNLGCAHALLGHPDEAFEALGRAVSLGFGSVAQLDGDTDLVSLHADPRWAALRARLTGGTADDPALRQLDFWAGEWDVTTAQGQPLGSNSIELQLNGHMLFEQWTGAGGDTGKSINYWDRDAQLWRQVWVSQGGNVLQMAGTFTDGAMRFEGATMYKNGATVKHRTTLKPLADGRVRQTIQESRDGGSTWTVGFDGYYARRATPTAAAATSSPAPR
ncbi:MAG: tetratricopeptide repeat protein [Planctomycetota bacterium]|jgi:tetratricopeptide (TPR) repeat protein